MTFIHSGISRILEISGLAVSTFGEFALGEFDDFGVFDNFDEK